MRVLTTLRALLSLFVLGLLVQVPEAHAQEAVFGEEVLGPGVKCTFIAAPADAVRPQSKHLSEAKTDIHLEVLAGWTEDASTEVGAPAGGFVPYLHIFARVENEKTDRVTKVSLVPHINQSDNAHYARNVALPGASNDPYTIVFSVHPPDPFELATHRDWRSAYGTRLFPPATVTYKRLQLGEVAAATRK